MPYPLKIRILGGPILSTQRIKIDLDGDYTFGDLFYYIRRQMPKILSEAQAANTLAVTPENYDLVFVDVQEGRAKTLETCTLGMKVKDAQWICPALMLRVRDHAIRTVIRAQSERYITGGNNVATSNSSHYTGGLNGSGTFRSVSFADTSSQNFERVPLSVDTPDPGRGPSALQRMQSTYMWSDNTNRAGGMSSLATTSPTNAAHAVSRASTTATDDVFDGAQHVQRLASGSFPTTPQHQDHSGLGVEVESSGGHTPSASDLMTALAEKRSTVNVSPPFAPSVGSPPFQDLHESSSNQYYYGTQLSSPPTAQKGPTMTSAWKKLKNVVTAVAPTHLKEFELQLDDGLGDGGSPSQLSRRRSSLTARLQDLPAGVIPSSGPTYAHDGSAQSYRERLMALLAVYDPKALRKIDRILSKSRGKEEQLLQLAVLKYGPEPKYSNVSRDGAFALANLSGTWSDPAVTGSSIRRASIGEETLKRATITHANSVITIDDDGLVSYKSQFRELVEFLFEEYDFLTPTAVSLFLQRVQMSPKPLAANLALHMQLYKHLRLDVEREDQLRRRIVQRELFVEQHASHQLTRALMWMHIACTIERRRFEGGHLILRTSIPPQFFLGWLYVQRQERYAWETVLRNDLATKQLVWFHSYQRTFVAELEAVHRRAQLVSQRSQSQHLQRFCYCDREQVRRDARMSDEYEARCILEQWRLIELERHSRIVHSVEVLEFLDRRCELFAYTSTVFAVPLWKQRFVEARFREMYEMNEVEARMRTVACISHRRAWIMLEQKYLIATEDERRQELERIRCDYIDKRKQQFEFGLIEADKRTLNIHFETGCRWRILQRRWMSREQVVRNDHMRQWLRERADLIGASVNGAEDASRRTLKRVEKARSFDVQIRKLELDAEPEGRWFHIFGESATYRHFQRQYRFFLESAARRDLQIHALTRQFWILETKRRGDIEIKEQDTIMSISSGGEGSMEAVRRQAMVLNAMRGLFAIFQQQVVAQEEVGRLRIKPAEFDARQRLFRRAIYDIEDASRRLFVRGREWVERETLSRWHLYQVEYLQRYYVLAYYAHLQQHYISAKAVVRFAEQRERLEEIKEPLDRGSHAVSERLDRDEIELRELIGLEDAKRKMMYRQERTSLRIPMYHMEKNDRDFVERGELAVEEHDRRLYWRMFELFTWERVPRLEIQYGRERKSRTLMERSLICGVEAIIRRRIAEVEQVRAFNVIEQRRIIDLERVVRRFRVEPSVQLQFQAIERSMLESTEEINRMMTIDRNRSVVHIFEQRSLQLYYFVVRAHGRQDEFIARKYIERDRLVDEEESSRRKMRNAALASLQKWWQRTNLQARQDVVTYANKLQREDDNRSAREGAQKRIEERLAARVAEKLRASVEAKRNQIVGIILSDETHARSALWESERTDKVALLHAFLEVVHDTKEMQAALVKAKQKVVRLVQGLVKIVKTAPSLEQFASMLPALPKRRRNGGAQQHGNNSPTQNEVDDETGAQRPSSDMLDDMQSNLLLSDSEHNGDEGHWEGAATEPRGFTRGVSMVLPPIARSGSMALSGSGSMGDGAERNVVDSAVSPTRRNGPRAQPPIGASGSDTTVPSELFEMSPMARPGLQSLRGSITSGGRVGGRSGSVTFPVSPASVSQVRVDVGTPHPTDDDDDGVRLPSIF